MSKAKKTSPSFDYASFEREAIARLHQGAELLGEDGILTSLVQRIVDAALEGELDAHLSREREAGQKNRRNGHTRKRIRSSLGEVEIHPPRDRGGRFDPQLIRRWSRELGSGVTDQILSLYARGNGVRDIQMHLKELYGLDYSESSISAVTDRVWEEVLSWQQRALESCYVVVFLDAIHFKVRESGQVQTKAIYTVYGVDIEGNRDVLGLYLHESEGARHWGLILEDLRRRGVEEMLFCCVDGLKGFPEVIETVFPHAIIQRCIVHLIRSSTRFVADKDRKAICRDLRKIYTATTQSEARLALDAFAQIWDQKYPQISRTWREQWQEWSAFLDFGPEIRRVIYTTNSVEALHRIMRKATKTKGAWVHDKSLLKQLYLALEYQRKSWDRKVFKWSSIHQELLTKFGQRYTKWL